jgi:4-hydroxy-tetrahydrodipicolinate synthase
MNTTHAVRTHHASLRGVFAAVATPMKANEDVDYEKLATFTGYLIDEGLHGLIPLGSTGEYYALDNTERERVLRVVIEATRGRVPVVAGTNAGSTRDVIAFSKQAEALGCEGVMLAPPYYSLPRLDELFEHFRAVNNAIGVPIMLYNYPGRTGVDMPPEFIERLAALKNVRYVKESTGEMARITELIRRCGDRMGVFCGCDTIALESLMVGAIGWVGGVANVLPRFHARLYELVVKDKDFSAARRLFYQALPTLEMMEGGGKYTQFVKAGCRLMGHDLGAPRRPLRRATAVECRRLRSVLKLSGNQSRF